jgi:hypothetical protein
MPQDAKKLPQFFDHRIGEGQVAGPVSMAAVQPHRPKTCPVGSLDVRFRGISDHHRLACGHRQDVARSVEDPGFRLVTVSCSLRGGHWFDPSIVHPAQRPVVIMQPAVAVAEVPRARARRATCRPAGRGAWLRTPRFRRSGPTPGGACRTGRRAATGPARRHRPAARLCRRDPGPRRPAGSGHRAAPATPAVCPSSDRQARCP